MSDWIEWGGGECPVSTAATVDVKLRNGDRNHPRRASLYNWLHGIGPFGYEGDDDIIAYRIHKES